MNFILDRDDREYPHNTASPNFTLTPHLSFPNLTQSFFIAKILEVMTVISDFP